MADARKSFRLALHSVNKISGDDSHAFFNISCSDILPPNNNTKYQYAVEYFASDDLAFTTVLAHFPNLTQVNSYSTLTGCENQCAIMLCSNNYSRFLSHNSIGHELTNVNWLRNGQLEVKFTDVEGTPLIDMSPWGIILVIWEVDK